MVDSGKIHRGYKQKEKSCVLASYAIVSNYFTGLPIIEFFEDYCKHYKIEFANGDEAEVKYGDHFQNEWYSRNLKGYQVILELHNVSPEKSFKDSRKYFDGEFILDSSVEMTRIITVLKTKEALLNITFSVGGGNCHSITVGWDSKKGPFYYDTVTDELYWISSYAELGTPRDSVLYIKSER